MANHINHAGIPFPLFANRYTVVIPYLDADGDPVDPTSPDTEVSKDGGAFADCINEVTVITGGNGTGYLTLTGGEMAAAAVVIAAKSANAKTTILTMNPYRYCQVGSIYFLTGYTSGSDMQINPANVASAFGTSEIHLAGMWIQVTPASASVEGSIARPIADYNPLTGDIVVSPPFEPSVLATGDQYIFIFPVGTGTILEQIIRSGGFAR